MVPETVPYDVPAISVRGDRFCELTNCPSSEREEYGVRLGRKLESFVRAAEP